MRIVVYNDRGEAELMYETRGEQWVNSDAPEEEFTHEEFMKDELPMRIQDLADQLADEERPR